ncbi:vacuolar-type H+-ATPase subunit I/STV1 [Borreliella spielmanii]|uniref:Vacuolar-type H+-ATPase subunit I/STV1 n=1 Tax=Borreliella spielmanii TaxID=88916 RepID=A0ABR6PA42_9SPIR|nr:ErpL protein [Borreliella spielmanii]MBB6032142.1 vacuolar-type H+-ATPase subunit I/STV1 [Borreliella spielmanii]
MNEKMRMFIICAVFALFGSCKNYVNDKASEQSLEIPKQIEQEIKKEFNGLLNILETKDLNTLDTKEIEKKIKGLKDKIEKTNAKETSLKTYLEYEKTVKEIREKLKDKLKDKKELEDKLKELEESLKNKKEERKKALQEAKKKFEEFKGEVNSATGVTQGQRAQNQRGGGQEAWKYAKEFGLSVSFSNSANNTSDVSNDIIDGAIKQIDEELKNIGEEAQNSEKKK